MIYQFKIRKKNYEKNILLLLQYYKTCLFFNKSKNINVSKNIVDVVLKIFFTSILVLDRKLKCKILV